MVEIWSIYDANDNLGVAAPAGYNSIDVGAGHHYYTYWHTFSNGEGNPTFTFTNPTGAAGAHVTVWNDVNNGNPIDQHEILEQTLNGTLGALTPTTANEDTYTEVWNWDFGSPPVPPGANSGASNTSTINNQTFMYATNSSATPSYQCVTTGHNCSGAEFLLKSPTTGQVFSAVRGVAQATSSGASINVPVDPRISNKDVVVCAFGYPNTTETIPSGFALLTGTRAQWSGCNFNQFTELDCYTANGTESGNWTFSAGSSQVQAVCFTIFGASCTTDPATSSKTATCSTGTSWNPTNLTTTNPNELALVSGAGSNATNAISFSNAAHDAVGAPSAIGTNQTIAMGFFHQAAAGATANQTITANGATVEISMMAVLTNTQVPISLGNPTGFSGLYPYPSELLNGRLY